MSLHKNQWVSRILNRSKHLAQQSFTNALTTDLFIAQRAKLDEKKVELMSDFGALTNSINEALTETSSVIKKINSTESNIHLRLIKTFGNKLHGILVLNYRGEIIFNNEIAQHILNVKPNELIGKIIDPYILTKNKDHPVIEGYSKKIMAHVKHDTRSIPDLRTILGHNKVEFLFDNSVMTIKPDSLKYNICVMEMTLLDINPKVIEDVIYVCNCKCE